MRSDRWFLLRQVGLVTGAALAYFGVRGLTEGDVDNADRNARALLEAERVLGVDIERAVQTAFASTDAGLTAMNWVYIWLHWPVLVATLLWLALRHRPAYLRLRNAMLVSGAIGLVLFALIPVTPPRLLDPGYIDTVTLHSNSYRVLQPPALVNAYAAFPSLHFGWNLLAGIALYRTARGTTLRVIGVLMPGLMGIAVVATANHWMLDVVAGGSLALGGLAWSAWWAGRRAQTPDTGRPRHGGPGNEPIARLDARAAPRPAAQPRNRTPARPT